MSPSRCTVSESPGWNNGDIVNFHVLLEGRWIPLAPKSETDGDWRTGDLVNNYVFTGREWIPAPTSAFTVYPPRERKLARWLRRRPPREGIVAGNELAPASAGSRLTRRERAEARRRAGRKPPRPRHKVARAARVGFPPSTSMWDIASHCVKCGRRLTNPDSQRHRVGTDCIKRYGSQARKIPNPAYTDWCARKARADADRITSQVLLDADFARQTAAYEQELAAWRSIRSGRV